MPRPGDAEITRDRLLTAAHELLTERAAGATVSEICSRASVNVAMVKYCFGSKDAMLDALLETVLERLAKEIERLVPLDIDPEAKLRLHVAAIVRNYVRYPYVNRLMGERLLAAEPDAVDRISRSFAIPAREFYAQLLSEGRGDGWRDMDPTLFFFTTVGLCEFLFSARPLLERSFGDQLDADLVERYIDHVTALIASGVR